MSFILDALKKSETERQQSVPAEFATVPSSDRAPATPRWLWVLAALLLVNVAVLVGLLTRDDDRAPRSATAALDAGAPAVAASPAADAGASVPFEERLSEARRRLPDRTPATPANADADDVTRTGTVAGSAPADYEASAIALLPSLAELRLDGRSDLPPLHVDIHVFSDDRDDRFVFINMNKYRERDRLNEGPTVEAITRDGVVLSHRGTRFVLPRE